MSTNAESLLKLSGERQRATRDAAVRRLAERASRLARGAATEADADGLHDDLAAAGWDDARWCACCAAHAEVANARSDSAQLESIEAELLTMEAEAAAAREQIVRLKQKLKIEERGKLLRELTAARDRLRQRRMAADAIMRERADYFPAETAERAAAARQENTERLRGQLGDQEAALRAVEAEL
ncbi:MAG: hypothetical protein C4547_09400, partial [Phycisphaerales bacterium]